MFVCVSEEGGNEKVRKVGDGGGRGGRGRGEVVGKPTKSKAGKQIATTWAHACTCMQTTLQSESDNVDEKK